jgi:hypothetical protein
VLGVPGDVAAAAADGVVPFSALSASGIVEDSMKKLDMPILLKA